MQNISLEKAKDFHTRLLRVMRDFSAEILCITKEINDAVQVTPEGEDLTRLIKLHIFGTEAEMSVSFATEKIASIFSVKTNTTTKPYLISSRK